jgi:cell division protein FtsN
VFTDVVKSKKGPLTRVRVGPYLSKALADAAAEKIKGMKLEAVVFQQ